jgi:hypothetical protein
MRGAYPAECSTDGTCEEDDPGTWETPKDRSREGRPKARETKAEAEGDGESEGRIGAKTPGNG